jgi:hypothetical protein
MKTFLKFHNLIEKEKQGSNKYVETGSAVEPVDTRLANSKLKNHQRIHGKKEKLKGLTRNKRDELESSILGLRMNKFRRYNQ